MTKEALIKELRELSPEDRNEIFHEVSAPAEDDYGLTEEEITMVRSRLKHYTEHPETGISFEEMSRRHGLLRDVSDHLP